MEEVIVLLMRFGLTRVEATIYYNLLIRQAMTGYELSKETKISRSNIYSSLTNLEKKGVIYLAAEEKSKYVEVGIEEFCDNYINGLKSTRDHLVSMIPKAESKVDNYITISGQQNIINKTRNMLTHAKQRVYISAKDEILMLFYKEFMVLKERGLRIVVITDKEMDLPASEIYFDSKEDNQLDLIIDSQEVISGRINQICLYSMNDNLIMIFKRMLKNEIEMIKLGVSQK